MIVRQRVLIILFCDYVYIRSCSFLDSGLGVLRPKGRAPVPDFSDNSHSLQPSGCRPSLGLQCRRWNSQFVFALCHASFLVARSCNPFYRRRFYPPPEALLHRCRNRFFAPLFDGFSRGSLCLQPCIPRTGRYTVLWSNRVEGRRIRPRTKTFGSICHRSVIYTLDRVGGAKIWICAQSGTDTCISHCKPHDECRICILGLFRIA